MDDESAELDRLGERLRGGGTAICVAPPPSVASAVVAALYEADETADGSETTADRTARGSTDGGTSTGVRLLTPATDKQLFPRFDRAMEAAELVERERLTIGTTEAVRQRLTVTDERVYAHLRTDDGIRSPTATDDPFRSAVWAAAEQEWETASPVTVSAPARSRFLRTFADEFPEAGETLANVLAGDDPIRRDGPLDPVSVVTLVAARHELQTLQLSEWAEALDFSSRTELSRVTGRLEDTGLLATERVPQGVGRPRQRLTLAADALRGCPSAEFLEQARQAYPDDD